MLKKPILNKLFLPVIIAVLCAATIYLTPPDVWWKILIVLLLVLLIVYILTSVFLSRKFVRLITAFSLIFLILNITIGFNLINTLLLASLLITLATVIK